MGWTNHPMDVATIPEGHGMAEPTLKKKKFNYYYFGVSLPKQGFIR
jgi:hypothetical protein